MEETLYTKLKKIEKIEEKIKNNNDYKIDIIQSKRNLFDSYSRLNETLNKIIKKEITLEETLNELNNTNQKFLKKFLPYKKNKKHNKKVTELKKLIPESKQLYHRGIFYPDNFVTATLEASTGILILEGINRLLLNNPTPNLIYPIISAISYGLIKNIPRFLKLPYKEAKYLDNIIKKLY